MLADNRGTSCRWSGATRHCTDVERTPCNDHLAPFPCDYSLHTDRTNSSLGLLNHTPSSKLCPQLMHGDFSNRTWRSFRCKLREVKVIERKVNVSRELGGKGRERIETLQVQNKNSRKLPNWKGFTTFLSRLAIGARLQISNRIHAMIWWFNSTKTHVCRQAYWSLVTVENVFAHEIIKTVGELLTSKATLQRRETKTICHLQALTTLQTKLFDTARTGQHTFFKGNGISQKGSNVFDM